MSRAQRPNRPPPAADEELFVRYQRGDEQAFAVLVERYWERIFGFLLNRLKQRELAEDLTQNTFLRVCQARHTFVPGQSSVSTWIHVIANNLLKNEYRNSGRRRVVAESDLSRTDANGAPTLPRQVADPAPSPEESVYQGELAGLLRDAIATIPEPHREPFIMREIEHLTYDEIAERLAIPSGTVKSRLNRARRHLRAALLPAHPGETWTFRSAA